MRAIYWLTAHLAAEAPMLLALDDVHWADASSLRALDYLARRIEGLPIVLVATLRPEEPGSRSDLLDELRAGADVRIATGPLRPESVAQIVRARIPGADDDVCAACAEATGANPLYLQELLRTLATNGAPPTASEVRAASIPSLGDRVLRRAQRVGAEAPALARSMAVLGDGASLDTAARLAGVSGAEAGQIAHRLRRAGVLSDEDPLAFVHPLIRRSVYDAIPDTERQAVHRSAAELLDQRGAAPELVATHLQRLRPNGEAAVAGKLLAAAQQALDRAAPDEAVDWLERALAEDALQPPRAEVLARLGMAKTLQRDPASIEHLREAYELAGDPVLRGQVAVTLAEILAHAGRWNDAIAVIESIEGRLPDTEPQLATEIAAVRAAITLYDPRRIDDFDARRTTYARLAQGDYWAAHALAVLLAAEASRRGRSAEALAHCERALEGGRLLRERGAGAWTTPELVGVFVELDELERAEQVIEQVDAAARTSGALFAQFTVGAFRGWAHAREGNLASAEGDLTAVLDLAEEAQLVMGITTIAFFLLDVLLERQNLGRVVEMVEETDLGEDFLGTVSGAMLLEVRGSLRIARHERERGIADLRAAGATNAALRFGPSFSTWRSSLAAALPPNDREEARALAGEELELARISGLARPHGIALRTLGTLCDGDASIDVLRRSVEILEAAPARLEHARSLVELGAALRRANHRRDARPPLAAGLELAHACGAQRLTARAREELQAAGGRRRRIASTGRESLTASELRVVKLAAAGATNTEIAQQLFVSLKTVETHLSRAYAKLSLAGSGSRARLAQVLGD